MKKIFILALFFAFAVQLGFSQFFFGGGLNTNVGMFEPSPSVYAEVGYRFPHRFISVGMIGKYWGLPSTFGVGVFSEAILFAFGRRSSFVAGTSFTYLHRFYFEWSHEDDEYGTALLIGLPLTWEVSVGRSERTALLFRIEPMLIVGAGNRKSSADFGLKVQPLGLRVFL